MGSTCCRYVRHTRVRLWSRLRVWTPTAPHHRGEKRRSPRQSICPCTGEEEGYFFVLYSSDMQALNVIGMVGNMDLYQILFGISNPRWNCSTVDMRRSAALKLFFRAGALPNTPLISGLTSTITPSLPRDLSNSTC